MAPSARAGRGHLVLAVLGIALLVLCGLGPQLSPQQRATDLLPWLQLPQVLLWAAACWWIWRRPGACVWLIVVFSVLFRLAAAWHAPALSSDVYRYPWDGRVQRAGISPYAHPPNATELTALRDAQIHPQINRPAARTVYPPGAQWLFATLPYDVDQVRWWMIACDLLTMLLLVQLLSRRRQDPARVVLYAWAPLAIWEVGNGGHLEAALLPFLLATVWLLDHGRSRRSFVAGLLFGQAVAMKLYPLALLPALWRRGRWRLLLASAAVVAILYLVYGLGAGDKVLGFLPQYVGSAEDHNIGLRRLFEALISGLGADEPRSLAFMACGLTFCLGAWPLQRRGLPLTEHLLALSGLWLATLPTALHPWYALWLLPWLVLHPRPAWLWLVALLPMSYLKYGAAGGLMPAWVVPLEWLPTLALLLVGWWRRAGRDRPAKEAMSS